tara:strand:+ start:46 stop:159 length:114 start_codon:yes stop_codon:yes gene_type:complete
MISGEKISRVAENIRAPNAKLIDAQNKIWGIRVEKIT